MKRMLVLVSVLAVSLVASGVLLAQENPFVGTWKLNVAKSKFTGMQPPKSETRTIVMQGNVETVTYEGIAADGSPISYSFKSNLDGKDSAISGTHPLGSDTVAAKRTFLGINALRRPRPLWFALTSSRQDLSTALLNVESSIKRISGTVGVR